MDESDVDISQASNNTDVLKEEEEFTDDLCQSRSVGACAADKQEKDGANDFDQDSLKQPISTASLKDGYFKSNFATKDVTNHQNNKTLPGHDRFPDEKNSSSTALDCNTVFQKSTSPSGDKRNATELDDSLPDDQIISRDFRDDPSVSAQGGPSSSSPIFGNNHLSTLSPGSPNLGDLTIDEPGESNSASISYDELSIFRFPEVPQNDPADSSIDGGSIVSRGSSHSLSKSYLYSSVDVDEDLPNSSRDDGDHLIPKFKANGKGFCWPMDKLPLSGDRKFEEDVQWVIKKNIGRGASGQCFRGCPVDNEDEQFCVKKCKYKVEEVKALCLAAKEMYSAKKISEGARKIVSFYGATYYKPDVCIFMEYMEGGTVKGAINEANRQFKDGLDKSYCSQYFKDVLQALDFIHRKGIVHKDIRSDNVLLTASRVEAKLSDFGNASAISGHERASNDVWSGGCFLLEMLGLKYSSALISGIAKKSDVLEKLPHDSDKDTKDVLSICFHEDRGQCTALKVLESNFFQVEN